MALKVAINGTGRIGLIAAKIVAQRGDLELVALNTTCDLEMLVYLLKYDSVQMGVNAEIIDDQHISINGCKVRVFSDRNLDNIDFGGCGAKVVIECTGAFLTTEKCQAYLKDGVEKTLVERIASLVGVRDVTDHSVRENAYYK